MFKKQKKPILLQGNLKKEPYFEGWYYKQVSKDGKTAISFIPGISLNKNDSHSFVQYIYTYTNEKNEKETKTGYIRYTIEEFKYQNKPFMIQIGTNIFTETFMAIDLQDEQLTIKGRIGFGPFHPIETSISQPTIMGPFAYIPKMECYHGIVSMNHTVSGLLMINDKKENLTGGKGYIEKDWGSSFPKQYRWIQCNHFADEETSLFFSVAHIPFHGMDFNGFISTIVVNDKEYRFATYNNSKLTKEEREGDEVRFALENKNAKLIINGKIAHAGELIAPKHGTMEKTIKEGVMGEVTFTLIDKEISEIFQDKGQMAGIEIVDDQ